MFISLFSLTLPVLFDIFYFIRFVLSKKPDSEINTICLELLFFSLYWICFLPFFVSTKEKILLFLIV